MRALHAARKPRLGGLGTLSTTVHRYRLTAAAEVAWRGELARPAGPPDPLGIRSGNPRSPKDEIRLDLVVMAAKPTVGVDLGGTRLRAARVRDGAIEERVSVHLDATEPEAVAAQLADVARSLGDGPVGIGVAGMLRGDTGIIANAPNLNWRDVPFADIVGRRLSRPVHLENDLSAIAWGEYRFGAGRGARSVACVFVGTGVGGGAVLDGKLYRGANNTSMEIGHVKIAPPDRTCGCGKRGCMETYVGGAFLGRSPDTEALEMAGTFLGRTLGDLCTLLNPDRLVLGGSVWRGEADLRARTLETLREIVNPPALEALAIVDDELGDDAGVLGVADLVVAQ